METRCVLCNRVCCWYVNWVCDDCFFAPYEFMRLLKWLTWETNIAKMVDKLITQENKIACKHESDWLVYTSNPPQYKCKNCNQFYK